MYIADLFGALAVPERAYLWPLVGCLAAQCICIPQYLYKGKTQWINDFKRPKFAALILFNLAQAMLCSHFGCKYLHWEAAPHQISFINSVFLPIVVIDIWIYTVHRLMHTKTLWPLHTVHHSCKYDKLHGWMLFYIHPIDGFLEHYLPAALFLPLAPASIGMKCGSSIALLFANTMAHAGLRKDRSHSKHHMGQPESWGIGIGLDMMHNTDPMAWHKWSLHVSMLYLFWSFSWPFAFWCGLLAISLRVRSLVDIKPDESGRSVRSMVFWRMFYTVLQKIVPSSHSATALMNWGYAETDEESVEDTQTFRKRMYREVMKGAPSKGRLLEVGCGTGGGLAHVSENFPGLQCEGVDLTAENLKRAPEGLKVRVDDAQTLATAKDNAYDVVLNVESSHCYPDFPAFIRSVARVLKTGGSFQYTDFVDSVAWGKLLSTIEKNGFDVVAQKNITPNVLHSSKLVSERYEKMYEKNLPSWLLACGLRTILRRFTNHPSSPVFQRFVKGELEYKMFRFVYSGHSKKDQ